MKLRVVSALATLALASACSKATPPGQYALSAHDAYERLAKRDLPDFISNRQCGVLIHVKAELLADKQVTWRITSSGLEMLSFTAIVTPVDASNARVDIVVSRIKDGKDAGKEAYDGTQFYPRPAVKQPVRPAIEEQVAALMEGRAFDAGNMPDFASDSVCNVQRAGLEGGSVVWSVKDKPGQQGIDQARARAGGVSK